MLPADQKLPPFLQAPWLPLPRWLPWDLLLRWDLLLPQGRLLLLHLQGRSLP